MLQGKKILLGITGSIAAYKSIFLVRLLIKAGAEVRVLLTPSAKNFVSALTLSTLSKNKVVSEFFDEDSWSNHVLLGRWADVFIIAPLSCNTLASMASGQCDNFLLATYLSATCPVVVAPAMDEDMWHHPATIQNIEKLKSFGQKIIPVEKGDLASGLVGEGRMAEPEIILQFIRDQFFAAKPLAGKRVLVTAGPTYEAIDPVRFIGNHSSGKMGMALAKELNRQGANVTVILGPVAAEDVQGIATVRIATASEMYDACMQYFKDADLTIMAAAVADYTPVEKAANKIKKNEGTLNIELKKTKDILKNLCEIKSPGQLVVGFALETTNEKVNAIEKLQKKKADMIILNSLNDTGAGFGTDTNKITIFDKSGKEFEFDTKPKQEVAKDIVNTIIDMYYV